MTLIFGLAAGWWTFEDAPSRLPGSPLLGVGSWTDALNAAGFRAVGVVALPATAEGPANQSVLVAESDGLAAADRPAEPAGCEPAGSAPAGSEPAGSEPAGSEEAVEPVRIAQEYVTEVFARVLELPVDRLDPAGTFDRYGVDSLVALELTRALEKDLGPLPATLLFEKITIGQLAHHLAAERPSALARLAAAAPPTRVAAPDEPDAGEVVGADGLRELVERLSESDVDRLIARLTTPAGAPAADRGSGR
jgi:acyl carrier protein